MDRHNYKPFRFLVMFLLFFTFSGVFIVQPAEAKTGSKPKPEKTTVSLYTTDKTYKINLLNTKATDKISYSSADKSIVTVSKKGTVKIKGAGQTTVSVVIKRKNTTYKSSIKFKIQEPYIKFTKTPPAKLKTGEKKKLKVKAYGTDAKGYIFKSDNTDILKVSSKGYVTALAPGTATITIYTSDKIAECKTEITVLPINPVVDKLLEIAEDNTGKNYNDKYLCKTTEEAEAMIIDIYSDSKYPVILVEDLYILPQESYFLEKYPAMTLFNYDLCIKYNNGYAVKAYIEREISLFTDEFFIDCAIKTNNPSILNEEETETYNTVMDLANTLKGKTEEETVQNIHDFLVRSHAYPTAFQDNLALHRLADCIDSFYCVCDGYAKCFYFLCNAAGIEALLVHGDAYGSPGKKESHSWNKVKIDGEWYNIDVTWDDPYPDIPGSISYSFYCVTDETLKENHVWDNSGYPLASSEKLGKIYH